MSGPLKEPFEIKVYEIDDVERLQRRRQEETTEVSGGSLLTCWTWWFILLDCWIIQRSGSRSCQSHSLIIFCMCDSDAIHSQHVPH